MDTVMCVTEAEIKKIDKELVAEVTTKNAARFFGIELSKLK